MSDYVSIDLETTGFDPNLDSIIEVGMVKFSHQGEVDRYATLLDPHRSIPYPVQRLTGIKNGDVEGAPSFEEVAADIVSFVGNSALIGHSLSFDLAFLSKQGISFSAPHYDTLELSKILITKARSRALGALTDQLGIHFPKRHRALADALAAMELFLAFSRQAEDLNPFLIALLAGLDAKSLWSGARFFKEIAQRLGIPPEAGDLNRGAWNNFVSVLEKDIALEPLTAKSERCSIDLRSIEHLLSPGGALSSTLPSFEHREEQIAMALRVAQSINDGQHLIVEAGTGTGKSFAYLLPAALAALQSNTTVVISTNTINLQEQLVNKDIPNVTSALSLLESNVPVGAALIHADDSSSEVLSSPRNEVYRDNGSAAILEASQLKGRSNYLCLRRLGSYLNYQKSPEEASFIARVLVWLNTTQTGDRGELSPNTREAPYWNLMSAQNGDCLGANCAFYRSGHCFLLRARQRAEASHLLIVNHALLLSDLLHEGRTIPEYDCLIVDEAHHLEDVATDQLGVHIRHRDVTDYLDSLYRRSDGRTTGLLAYVESFITNSGLPLIPQAILQRVNELGSLVDSLRNKTDSFFNLARDFLNTYSAHGNMYGQRLRVSEALKRNGEWRGIQKAWEELNKGIDHSNEGLEGIAVALDDMELGDGEQLEDLIMDIHSYVSQGKRLQETLSAFVSVSEETQVSWLEEQAQGNNISLSSAPLGIASELERLLFSKKSSVILTSATLQVSNSFGYIRERLGVSNADELSLKSPFNYKGSTLVYIPTDMPEPEKRNHMEVLQRTIIDTCSATNGRALVLFTSHAALQSALSNISAPLEREGIRVLAQGTDGSADQVLMAFKEGPKCVLLGTSSLWEGIDVVGDALSLLIITRLPFPVPTDPVFAARGELYKDSFNQYSLPQAILRFRQGFGRLIRSKNDRGAVLVLDPRVIIKSYGGQFLKSLPECTTIRGSLREAPSQVASWLMLKKLT